LLGAFAAEIGPKAPDLAAVISAWPALPQALRAGIVAMVKAAIVVHRNYVCRSLGCLKGQDAGFPSDLVFTWRGTAHQEGDTTFFRSKISW